MKQIAGNDTLSSEEEEEDAPTLKMNSITLYRFIWMARGFALLLTLVAVLKHTPTRLPQLNDTSGCLLEV